MGCTADTRDVDTLFPPQNQSIVSLFFHTELEKRHPSVDKSLLFWGGGRLVAKKQNYVTHLGLRRDGPKSAEG